MPINSEEVTLTDAVYEESGHFIANWVVARDFPGDQYFQLIVKMAAPEGPAVGGCYSYGNTSFRGIVWDLLESRAVYADVQGSSSNGNGLGSESAIRKRSSATIVTLCAGPVARAMGNYEMPSHPLSNHIFDSHFTDEDNILAITYFCKAPANSLSSLPDGANILEAIFQHLEDDAELKASIYKHTEELLKITISLLSTCWNVVDNLATDLEANALTENPQMLEKIDVRIKFSASMPTDELLVAFRDLPPT